MKLEPGTCRECVDKTIDGCLLAVGLAWILSPEDGLNHWGREENARVCGEMKAVEYAVVCGRNFVTVTKA